MDSSKSVNNLVILMKAITSLCMLVFFLGTSACDISNKNDVGDGDSDIPLDGDSDEELSDVEDDSEDESDQEEDLPFDTELLDLSVSLEQDSTRAGVIRQEEELLEGSEATGVLGDFKMYNSKIAVVISQVGTGKVFTNYGGAIIDAVRLEDNQQVSGDLLKEAFPIIGVMPRFLPLDGDIREFMVEEITLIHNGSDGRPAHIRATGTDAAFMYMTSLLESPVFPNPSIDVKVDYYLDADADYVRIESQVVLNEDAEEHIKEVIRTGMGIFASDDLDPFYPDMEFVFPETEQTESDEIISQHKIDFFAFTSKDISYAVGDGNNQKTFALLSKYEIPLTLGPQDSVISAEDTHKYSHVFYIGEGSAAQMTDQVSAHNLAIIGEGSESGLVKISGSVAGYDNWKDKDIEVLAVLVEDVTPEPAENSETAGTEEDKVYKYYYKNKAYPDSNGKYEFSVPDGTYLFMAETPFKQYEYSSKYLVEGDDLTEVSIQTPLEPHHVSFSVKEKLVDVAEADYPYIPARVDFYQGDYSVNATTGDITYNFGNLLATAYADESGQVTADVPMSDNTVVYTAVAYHNEFYTVAMETNYIAGAGGSSTHNLVLEKVVAESFDIGEKTYKYRALNLDMKSSSSLDSGFSMKDKALAAKAAGFDVSISSDTETVSNYDTVDATLKLSSGNYPLFVYPGYKVNPSWSSFTGANVTKPEDASNYYDISTISFTSTGSYAGRRTVAGVWNDLKEIYQASLVQVNTPRGADNSFFEYFAKDEYENGYDTSVGISSLKYEAKSTLDEWDTLEILNPNISFYDSMLILQDWLSFLEHGIYKPITASSDLQLPGDIKNGRMGYARTMLYSELDDYNINNATEALDLARKGQSFVTTGPVIKMSIDGVLPGNTVTFDGSSSLQLSMQVYAPEWMPVYAVFTCIDGNIVGDYHNWVGEVEGVERYNYTFPVGPILNNDETPASTYRDTYVVAMVLYHSKNGDKTPADPGYPVFAVTNPVFIEADGVEGFRAPLDLETVTAESAPPYCMSSTMCSMIYSYYDGDKVNMPEILDVCKELYCIESSTHNFCSGY